jgi:hypothetical protein
VVGIVTVHALAQAVSTDLFDRLVDRVPIAGGALVLIAIIGIVTRLWLSSETRHRSELNRINRAHDVEIKALGQRVSQLRVELDQMRTQLEEERRLRWRAQDVAAERRRRGPAGGGHGERGERQA